MSNNNDRPHTVIIDNGDTETVENHPNYANARDAWLKYDAQVTSDDPSIFSVTVKNENGKVLLHSEKED